MKAFCPKCGQPNEYGGVKPNFCGFCSSPLTITANATSIPAYAQRRPAPVQQHQQQLRRRPQPAPPVYVEPIQEEYYDDEGYEQYFDDDGNKLARAQRMTGLANVQLVVDKDKNEKLENVNITNLFGGGALAVQNNGSFRESQFDSQNKEKFVNDKIRYTFAPAKESSEVHDG